MSVGELIEEKDNVVCIEGELGGGGNREVSKGIDVGYEG